MFLHLFSASRTSPVDSQSDTSPKLSVGAVLKMSRQLGTQATTLNEKGERKREGGKGEGRERDRREGS